MAHQILDFEYTLLRFTGTSWLIFSGATGFPRNPNSKFTVVLISCPIPNVFYLEPRASFEISQKRNGFHGIPVYICFLFPIFRIKYLACRPIQASKLKYTPTNLSLLLIFIGIILMDLPVFRIFYRTSQLNKTIES